MKIVYFGHPTDTLESRVELAEKFLEVMSFVSLLCLQQEQDEDYVTETPQQACPVYFAPDGRLFCIAEHQPDDDLQGALSLSDFIPAKTAAIADSVLELLEVAGSLSIEQTTGAPSPGEGFGWEREEVSGKAIYLPFEIPPDEQA